MSEPLVSCICATYNRPPDYQHLVEEAIESFLRQDYPNKELIVLNDCPGQKLYCDAEGVFVFNVPVRFPTLGEKRNAATDLSRGELIAPWDDDDISLPWRLSYSVERLQDADYFNPRAYWYLPTDGLHHDHPVGYAHNASVFTRMAFDTVGGYASKSLGEDADMDHALLSALKNVVDPHTRGSASLTIDEWFYIYRWGVSPHHVSSIGETDQGRYLIAGMRPTVPGVFQLRPHWRTDYVELTQDVVEEQASNSA